MSTPQIALESPAGFHLLGHHVHAPSAPSWRTGGPWAGLALIVLLHGVFAYALLHWQNTPSTQPPAPPVLVSVVDTAAPESPTPPAEQLVPEFAAPPPPFVPIPEIVVSQPAPPPPITTATAVVPPPPSPAPPLPFVAAASSPDATAAPPATSGPVRSLANVGAVCPNSSAVRAALPYPDQALRRNISGKVLVQFLITASGQMRDLHVVGEAPQILANAALTATRKFNCQGQGRDVLVQVPYTFHLN